MTIREIAENLISAINAGGSTLDMKWYPLQVEAMIPALRQEAINIKYNGGYVGNMRVAGNGKINGDWVQKYDVVVDQSIQNPSSEYIRVVFPPVISLTDHTDGLIYVGASKTSRFYKCHTRDELNTLKTRGFVNNGTKVIYLYSDSELEIYGDNMLKSFYVEIILSDPAEKPGFNLEYDRYPVSDDILLIMIELFKKQNNIAITQPKDTIVDQAATPEIRTIKSNL